LLSEQDTRLYHSLFTTDKHKSSICLLQLSWLETDEHVTGDWESQPYNALKMAQDKKRYATLKYLRVTYLGYLISKT